MGVEADIRKLQEQMRRVEADVRGFKKVERRQHVYESFPAIGDPNVVSKREYSSGYTFLQPILLTETMELRVATVIGLSSAGQAFRVACAIYRAMNPGQWASKDTLQANRPRMTLKKVADLGVQTSETEVLTAQQWHFRQAQDVVLEPDENVFYFALQVSNGSNMTLYSPANHSRAVVSYYALEAPYARFGLFLDELTLDQSQYNFPLYFMLRSALGVRIMGDSYNAQSGTPW